jgi:hypothetical protein
MFFEPTAQGYILRIRVTPNSSRCAVSGIFTDNFNQDYLKVSLTAVPEKGKANKELIKFLSQTLDISKQSFTLITGETDRYKKILLESSPSSFLEEKLSSLEITS